MEVSVKESTTRDQKYEAYNNNFQELAAKFVNTCNEIKEKKQFYIEKAQLQRKETLTDAERGDFNQEQQ